MASIGSIHAEQLRRRAMEAEIEIRDRVVESLRVKIEAVRIAANEIIVDAFRELAAARLECIRLRGRIEKLEGR